MSEELMNCPVCGAMCQLRDGDSATVTCSYYRCGYAMSRGHHNTLARRARIGELAEKVLSRTGFVMMKEESDGYGRMYDVRTHERGSYTDTLLAALEAIAKAIGGDDGK